MSEVAKAGRGRPSRWGKNDGDKSLIAKDLKNFNTLTPYYQQKLMKMGLIEIKVTGKGEDFLNTNAA